MVQWFAMNQVNDDGALKKIWINLHLHAANAVDKLARRSIWIMEHAFTKEYFADFDQ